MYPSPAQTNSFNGSPTIYFAHPPSSITSGPTMSQVPQHFHQYQSTRAFENTNHHQCPLPSFQSTTMFQSTLLQPPTSVSSTSQNHREHEASSIDFSSHYRPLKAYDHENKLSQQRPVSGDFERLQNINHCSSSRFFNDNRFQSRPQSFYDFSSHQQSNYNNSFLRASNNNRYQRNTNINSSNNTNNTSLPLSAYIKADDSLDENDSKKHANGHWGTSYQKRRPPQPRVNHQDKHQFPLSLYDPRQYGFSTNSRRRNELNNQLNINRTDISDNGNYNDEINTSNDIDLIEEWWEDNSAELIESKQTALGTNSKATNVDDSGNSSLSTSMNLKESTLDDISTNDFINPPSNVSTTDSMLRF